MKTIFKVLWIIISIFILYMLFIYSFRFSAVIGWVVAISAIFISIKLIHQLLKSLSK